MMDNEKRMSMPTKCSVEIREEAKVVVPCWALSECLDAPYGRGTKAQGLTQTYMVNMKTGSHSRSPIVFKGGEHRKGGLVLNYCPWCGSRIATHDEENDE